MYCLVCREDGPDLILEAAYRTADGGTEPVTRPHDGRIDFDCFHCGRHCSWFVRITPTGITYEPVQ